MPDAPHHIEVAVVGAGVVGLAIARELALLGYEVVVIEQAGAIGTGISSRNSEVIHAGIYYPSNSLKAKLSVRGNALLVDYCQRHGVPYRRCGKLVVACQEKDLAALDRLADQGTANGVQSLERLSRAQALALEPELDCAGALWVPSSGIVDSHALMNALLGDAEAAGAVLALASRVERGEQSSSGWKLQCSDGFELTADWVINAAGLFAAQLSNDLGVPQAALRYARGHYFSLSKKAPFSRLIYPLPVDGGLGVHLTLDLAGQARFGPDVQWLDDRDPQTLDYAVDQGLAPVFETEIRRYWPDLPPNALQPAYSGIRPKLSGPGEPATDFVIELPRRGLVNLLGIESPGLTASLALAEEVAGLIRQAEGGRT